MVLSIVAIAISLISLVWTIKNQRRQNKQGVLLNQANVQLTKVKLVFFKECTRDEINKRDYWGYKFTAYPDDSFTKFFLAYYVIAKFSDTRKNVEKFNPVFTLTEAMSQARDLGISDRCDFYKQFKTKLQFENIGKTEALNLEIRVQIANPISGEWKEAFVANKSSKLSIGIPIHITIGYAVPIDHEEPNMINYRIEIFYEDVYKKEHLKKITLQWNKNNTWAYLND